MSKNTLIPSGTPFDRSFDLLLMSTLNSLKKDDFHAVAKETNYLLSKPELLALVKGFHPEDATELLYHLSKITCISAA
jgi:hypothetical protein